MLKKMLRLEGINKKLGNFRLTDISINIPEGEYFVLLGRSGSGKSQLLELIAGLKKPDSGNIWIDNQDVTNKKIQNRKTGLVFQDYAIFPNMTVYGNIAYPLRCRKTEKNIIRKKVEHIAGELNIAHLLDRVTYNLSGGELQRVALARTLITSPKVLLLDEPLASVDASLRDDIRRLLRQLNKKGITIVHVTHDYREAISLASCVGVIHNGRMIQSGPPDYVFSNPVSRFVARYSGIRNFYKVRFINERGIWKAISHSKAGFILSDGSYPEDGILIIRSDSIKIHKNKPVLPDQNCYSAVVREIIPSDYGMEITVDAGERFFIDITRDEFRALQIAEMSEVWISFEPSAAVALNGSG